MRVKKIIEYIFGKLSLEIIPRWRINSFLLSRRMKRIIEEFNIDLIIDVGANKGQYAEFLRNEVQYKGLIISFEPDPTNCKILKESRNGDNQWLLMDYALGKEDDRLNLNIMESSLFNSFLTPDNSNTNQFKNQNMVNRTIEVPVKRLDNVLHELRESLKFERAFLKLDTQGYDLEVFRGVSGSLDIILGVQTEVSVLPIYQNMPSLEESLSFFKAKGFQVSGFYPVDESRFPHAVEFDCILLPTEI